MSTQFALLIRSGIRKISGKTNFSTTVHSCTSVGVNGPLAKQTSFSSRTVVYQATSGSMISEHRRAAIAEASNLMNNSAKLSDSVQHEVRFVSESAHVKPTYTKQFYAPE